MTMYSPGNPSQPADKPTTEPETASSGLKRRWTIEEDDWLVRCFKSCDSWLAIKACSERFGRTRTAVDQRYKELTKKQS